MVSRALGHTIAGRAADLRDSKSDCAPETGSTHQPGLREPAPIAPYEGPSSLVFGSCEHSFAHQTAGTVAAKERNSVEPTPLEEAPEEDSQAARPTSARWSTGVGKFFEAFENWFAGPTPEGVVRKTGQSSKVPWGGVATLISYEALDPRLAKELKELIDRSERERREYSWVVSENGEKFDRGDENSVSPSIRSLKGNVVFHLHTHPNTPQISGTGENAKAPNSRTNEFSFTDWQTFQLLHQMFPSAVNAVATRDGLLLYLRDKPPITDPIQFSPQK